MKRTLSILDIDQLLIFFLLAVTVNQMGHYLGTFAPPGMWWIGYLQAIAVDFAIWRSAWWYRRYTGRKQRRWALVGVAVFAAVSAWYNQGYYQLADPSLAAWERWLMGAILPLGVALLSYLKGVKDESRFGEPKASQAERVLVPVQSLACDQCGRTFVWPVQYENERAAQNALNAHKRSHGNKPSENGGNRDRSRVALGLHEPQAGD